RLKRQGISINSSIRSLRPVIPINARTLRITAAAGTELAGVQPCQLYLKTEMQKTDARQELFHLYIDELFLGEWGVKI
ncbi:hypothetical protein GASC598I20_000130, partial [Gilliamella apicola SCGC AB-598-I20]